jgi:hypothetical protein
LIDCRHFVLKSNAEYIKAAIGRNDLIKDFLAPSDPFPWLDLQGLPRITRMGPI